MRESGYYWVKDRDVWMIGEYDQELKQWSLTFTNHWRFTDEDFQEIDEVAIVKK